MFSKLAATFLSTVGASSAPVVAIIVYYQIKKNSLELEPVSAFKNKNDDEIISTEKEKQQEKQVTSSEPEEKNADVSEPEVQEEKDAQDSLSVSTSTTHVAKKVEKEENSSPKLSDNSEQKPLSQEDLQTILKNFLSNNENNGDTNKNGNSLNEKLENFISLLGHAKNSLNDQGEKTQVIEVINAFTQLKTKISSD